MTGGEPSENDLAHCTALKTNSFSGARFYQFYTFQHSLDSDHWQRQSLRATHRRTGVRAPGGKRHGWGKEDAVSSAYQLDSSSGMPVIVITVLGTFRKRTTKNNCQIALPATMKRGCFVCGTKWVWVYAIFIYINGVLIRIKCSINYERQSYL